MNRQSKCSNNLISYILWCFFLSLSLQLDASFADPIAAHSPADQPHWPLRLCLTCLSAPMWGWCCSWFPPVKVKVSPYLSLVGGCRALCFCKALLHSLNCKRHCLNNVEWKKISVSYVSPGFRYLGMIDSCTVGESAWDSTSTNYMRKYCLRLWCDCILHMCTCVWKRESVYAAFTWMWMWCQQQIRVDKAWLSPSFPLIVCFEHSSFMQMHNP